MQNISLTDPTWTFLLAVAVAGCLTHLVKYLHRQPRSKHKRRRYVSYISAYSVILTLTAYWLLRLAFPRDIVPLTGLLWAAPLAIAIVLCFYLPRNKETIPYMVAAVPSGLLLLFGLANAYYNYYPTVGALFGVNTTIQVNNERINSKNTVSLEDYFAPLPNQPKQGKMESLDIKSSSKNYHPRKGYIYTPPALIGNDQLRLPVVVMMGGVPGGPDGWIQHDIKGVLDSFAKAHKGLAPIVAVVDYAGIHDKDTECLNSPLGDAETYLTVDVPNYLREHYQVSYDYRQWSIGGYSAGGMCGMMTALKHPKIYHNYLNISGQSAPSLDSPAETLHVLFGGSKAKQAASDPNKLLSQPNADYDGMGAWYFIGNQDQKWMIDAMQAHVKLAKRQGMDARFTSVDGGHTFNVWKPGFPRAPWLMHHESVTK